MTLSELRANWRRCAVQMAVKGIPDGPLSVLIRCLHIVPLSFKEGLSSSKVEDSHRPGQLFGSMM